MPVRKYTLELADGQAIPVEAEDTYSPEEVQAEALKRYPQMIRLVPHGKDLANSVKTGAAATARGFTSAGGFMHDVLSFPSRASDFLKARGDAALEGKEPPTGFEWLPQSQRLEQAYSEFLPRPKGGSTAERYAVAGAEGVGGALATGPSRSAAQAIWNLVTGGLSGAAAEGAKEAGAGTLGQVGASGGTALISSLLARKFNPNASQLAREALENVDPANLDVGIQRMERARAAGLPINLSQGMMAGSNIDDLVDFLANSKSGDRTIAQLREQPRVLNLRAQSAVANLPGRIEAPQQLANEAQDAATAALKGAESRARGAYVSKLPAGTQVPEPSIKGFEAALEAYAAGRPNTAAADMARAVKASLAVKSAPPPAPGPVGKGLISSKITPPAPAAPGPSYLTDATQLKNAVEDVLQGYGRNMQNTGAVSKDLNRYAAEIRALFDRTVAPAGSPMREARAAARNVYQTEVNPLRKGPVGRVAGVRGAVEEKEAALGPMRAILARGTPSGATSEILTLEKSLRASDPQLFPSIVKTHIAERLNQVLPTSGTPPQKTLARDIKTALAKTPDERRGLEDMLAGVARSQGLPEPVVVQGFMNFLDLAEAAQKVPAKISGLPARDIFEIGGKSLGADVAQVQYFSGIGRKIRQVMAADAYGTMDKLLTSPEGARALQALAKGGPVAPSSVAAVSALLGLAGQNPGGTIPE